MPKGIREVSEAVAYPLLPKSGLAIRERAVPRGLDYGPCD